MSDHLANLSLLFACVATHETAKHIRAADLDEPHICDWANDAQCYGIVRVSGRILEDGRWSEDMHQPIYGAAYRAVNQALLQYASNLQLRGIEVDLAAFVEDARVIRCRAMDAR